jgi:hypothetical protein
MIRIGWRLSTRTPIDYLTAIESVGWAVAVEIGLRRLSMSTLLALIDRVPRLAIRTPGADRWQRLARFAAVPYRIVAGEGTCLRRSLVLAAMLRRRGVPAHVRIGIARRDGAMAAHAWVTVAGSTLDDSPPEFVELTRAWSA